MEKRTIQYMELSGTSEEIGRKMAQRSEAKEMYVPAPPMFTKEIMQEAFEMYERFCPGIVEELKGFSEESHIAIQDLAYSWMTYLLPRCCGIALQGSRMEDGHTRLARSYEFGLEQEDMLLVRTCVKGKYTHIGATVAVFGRSEGINEHGLAVSQSSCGFPVSNIPQMRAPGIKGLQFWAVIRSLLENCKTVEEALEMLKDIPIAYNINLYLADPTGTIVIYETMNGEATYEKKMPGDVKGYVCGTNHIAIPSFQDREPAGMRNSIIRLEKIEQFMQESGKKSEEELRQFLLTKYPEGPMAYFYDDFFGTVRSVVMDVEEKRYSVCWLGQDDNGWKDFYVNQELKNHQEEAVFVRENSGPGDFEMIPIPRK